MSGGESGLSALLEVLIDTLSVCDEGSIYVVDSERRTLRQEISLGPYSWFGQFPEFRLGEGNVGRAFQIGEPVASESRQQLERYLEGLGTVREESLAQQPASFSPPLPSRTIATPLLWGEEAVGVLLLAWQDETRGLDSAETSLVDAFCRYIAVVVGQLGLNQRLERQAHELDLHRRSRDVLQGPDGVKEFVAGLREVVPFDCVRVTVARGGVIQQELSYFWCTESLRLEAATIDPYLEEVLQAPPGQRPEILTTQNGVLAAPIELSRRGIRSVVGVPFQANDDHQPPLVCAALLLHTEAHAYTPAHFELLKDLGPYLGATVSLAATSAQLTRKSIQTNAFGRIISLAATSGGQDTLIRGIIDSIAEGWKEPGLSEAFVLRIDGSGTRLDVTTMNPDEDGKFRYQVENEDRSPWKSSPWPRR